MGNLTNEVELLIKRIEKEGNTLHVMQLSQAALNAANALRVLADIPESKPETDA